MDERCSRLAVIRLKSQLHLELVLWSLNGNGDKFALPLQVHIQAQLLHPADHVAGKKQIKQAGGQKSTVPP